LLPVTSDSGTSASNNYGGYASQVEWGITWLQFVGAAIAIRQKKSARKDLLMIQAFYIQVVHRKCLLLL
jgi:hypothetical protein